MIVTISCGAGTMPITAVFDHELGVVRTTAVGVNHGRGHVAASAGRPSAAGPQLPPELVDARGIIVAFKSADVREAVNWLRYAAQFTRLGAVAVVVDADAAFGMVRMLQLLTEEMATYRPFRNMLEAEVWVLQAAAD
jgi:hypothetical protein